MITAAAWILAGIAIWFTRSVLDMFGDARHSTRVALLPSIPELAGHIVLALVLSAGVAAVVRRWSVTHGNHGSAPDPTTRFSRAEARLQIALPLFGLAMLVLPYLPWLSDFILPLRALAGRLRHIVWVIVVGQMIIIALTVRARFVGHKHAPLVHRTLGTIAIFSVTLALAVAADWRLGDSRAYPSGDEPRYMLMMRSLWDDHDLQIENNSASSLAPDSVSRGRAGALYPVQPVGLAILGAPILAWSGYHGLVWMMGLLTALTAVLMWRWAFAYTGSAEAATCAWAGIFLGAPLLLTSIAIYPDIPAALCVMIALAWGSSPTTKRPAASHQQPAGSDSILTGSSKLEAGSWFIRGVAVSALPWLSPTYALMAVTLTFVLARRLSSNHRAVTALLGLFTVSIAGWLAFFYIIWGYPSPMAPFGSQPLLGNLPTGVLGLLFDQEFGVVAYAPVLALGLLALWRMTMARDVLTRSRGQEIAVLFASLLISAGALKLWWGGAAPPGRPLVAGLPLLGLPLAWAYWRASASAVRRSTYQLLVLAGLAVSAAMVLVENGALIVQNRDGVSGLLQWLTDLWPAWEVVPSIAAFGLAQAAPLLMVWIAAAALVRWLIDRHPTQAPGTSALLTTAYCGATLLAVATIAPAVGRPPFAWVLQPQSRSRVPILDNFDSIARPHAVVYNPLTFVRPDDVPPLLTLAAAPGERPASQPVRVLLNARYALPAGAYEVKIGGTKSTEPARGYVALQVGRLGSPMREWQVNLAPGAVWTSTFKLPVDVDFVGFIAKPPLDTATSLTIRPLHIVDRSHREAIFHGGLPLPVLSARVFPGASVFFHDEAIYTEDAGIWIRGHSTARMTVAPEHPDKDLTLRVHSGQRGNAMTFVTTTWGTRVELEPGVPRDVHIPAPPQPGPFVLSVTTDTGFVPADVIPGNADRRVLGGWIEIAN